MIIAVDGPTASGKGTIAKALAAHFGLPHLDTGLLYRAVGRQVFLDGGDPDNAGDALAACSFPEGLLLDPELRSEASGGLASRVSVHHSVREALYDRQRAFATQSGGAVLDGRDIGTVIAPDAEVKLFVTASLAARAERRWMEMRARGDPHQRLRYGHLGHRTFGGPQRATVEDIGAPIDHQFGLLQVDGIVGQHKAHALMVDQRFAEGLTPTGIV